MTLLSSKRSLTLRVNLKTRNFLSLTGVYRRVSADYRFFLIGMAMNKNLSSQSTWATVTIKSFMHNSAIFAETLHSQGKLFYL
jgi:hypothetical protein